VPEDEVARRQAVDPAVQVEVDGGERVGLQVAHVADPRLVVEEGRRQLGVGVDQAVEDLRRQRAHDDRVGVAGGLDVALGQRQQAAVAGDEPGHPPFEVQLGAGGPGGLDERLDERQLHRAAQRVPVGLGHDRDPPAEVPAHRQGRCQVGGAAQGLAGDLAEALARLAAGVEAGTDEAVDAHLVEVPVGPAEQVEGGDHRAADRREGDGPAAGLVADGPGLDLVEVGTLPQLDAELVEQGGRVAVPGHEHVVAVVGPPVAARRAHRTRLAAEAVGGLPHLDVETGGGEGLRAHQTGQAATQHDHVSHRAQV
jgi:hypothetical protein